jgi:hypothetical protein|nr:MAG TPA: ATP-dependent DNA helicase [Bacteriophage sp.]
MLKVGDRVEHNTFVSFIGEVVEIRPYEDETNVAVRNEEGNIFWDDISTWDLLHDSVIHYGKIDDNFDGETIDIDAVIDLGTLEG